MSTGRYPDRDELATWTGLTPSVAGIYSPAVNELVAIGAAIAANCEPCLKYHYHEAQQLGVSKADMARAVGMGAKVKDSPHQAILKLADRLTGASLEQTLGRTRCLLRRATSRATPQLPASAAVDLIP